MLNDYKLQNCNESRTIFSPLDNNANGYPLVFARPQAFDHTVAVAVYVWSTHGKSNLRLYLII